MIKWGLPLIGQRVYTRINRIGQRRQLMNEKFYALPEEKQSQILNAAYKVFATNQYKKALYLFLWKHAADLTKKYMRQYKVYETDDFF